MANILDQMTPFNKVDTVNVNTQIINGIKHKMAIQSERRARIISHNKGVAQANADARAKAKALSEEKINSKRIINNSFTIKNVDVF